MNKQNSLVIFEKAEEMLAAADTIQKAKEFKSIALTAADWARRKGMGEKVVQHCVRYSRRAEIRLGELLDHTDRAPRPAGPGRGKVSIKALRTLSGTPPTLAELGVSRRESADAQVLASAPKEDREDYIEGLTSKAKIKLKLKKLEQAKSRSEIAKTVIVSEQIVVGDFREHADKIKNGTLDLIFTDPPYDRASIGLYGDLAEFAERKLLPGGSLLAYCGHYLLPELLPMMSRHLRFWWVIACLHGGPFARMREYGIIVQWKPILWFVKGTRGDKETWIPDRTERASGKEKDSHPWQQAQCEAEQFIELLCPKDGIVCDPFLGGGTTGAAAEKLKRKWIGFEIDKDQAAVASKRIFK